MQRHGDARRQDVRVLQHHRILSTGSNVIGAEMMRPVRCHVPTTQHTKGFARRVLVVAI